MILSLYAILVKNQTNGDLLDPLSCLSIFGIVCNRIAAVVCTWRVLISDRQQ